MKWLLSMAAVLLLGSAAAAQTYGTLTPDYAGGYYWNTYGDYSASGHITPDYAGGWYFNQHAPAYRYGGYSRGYWGYSPRYGRPRFREAPLHSAWMRYYR